MSRSGYTDDYDNNPWDMIRWRGAVTSAIRGKRGQAFLREMLAAFDALPLKELIAMDLVTPTGGVCAIGAVCAKRGLDVSKVDPEDRDAVGEAVGIPMALAAEIAYVNDEGRDFYDPDRETPAERFTRVRAWVQKQITEARDAD